MLHILVVVFVNVKFNGVLNFAGTVKIRGFETFSKRKSRGGGYCVGHGSPFIGHVAATPVMSSPLHAGGRGVAPVVPSLASPACGRGAAPPVVPPAAPAAAGAAPPVLAPPAAPAGGCNNL